MASPLTAFLAFAQNGTQSLALENLKPCTLVIGSTSMTASCGVWRSGVEFDDMGQTQNETRTISVRVRKALIDIAAVPITLTPDTTDCTVNGITARIRDIASSTEDSCFHLTCVAANPSTVQS